MRNTFKAIAALTLGIAIASPASAATNEATPPPQDDSAVVSVTPINDGSWQGTKTTYADGTVDIVKVELPKTTLSYDPRLSPAIGTTMLSRSGHVDGCTAIPDSGGWKRRINCRVYSSQGSEVDGFFRADYSVKPGGGRIDHVYSPEIQTSAGVTCKDPQLSITRKVNQGSAPAVARMTASCSFLKVGSTYTAWMELRAYGSVWVADKSTS